MVVKLRACVVLVALNSIFVGPMGSSLWADETAAHCSVPPPLVNFDERATYVPGTDRVDREAVTYNNQVASPLHSLLKMVGQFSDEIASGNSANGQCFHTVLETWSANRALLGVLGQQANYERQWALAGLSLALWKTHRFGEKLHADELSWLKGIADSVREFHDQADLRNNHASWAALGVGVTALLTGDKSLLEWAVARETMVLDQVQDDGTIGLELRRGPRASSYHVFSAIPVLVFHKVRQCEGISVQRDDPQLGRLVNLIDLIRDKPQLLATRVGIAQFPSEAVSEFDAISNPALTSMFDEKLGGNDTILSSILLKCDKR